MALYRARQTMQDAFIESFNGRLRDELLNETLLTSLASPRRACMLAGRLQRRTTTLAARMDNSARVHHDLSPATGSGAALCRRLRASSRRSHPQQGKSNGEGELRTG